MRSAPSIGGELIIFAASNKQQRVAHDTGLSAMKMKVYVVISNSACNGVSETIVSGVYADEQDAKDRLNKLYESEIGDYEGEDCEIEIEDNWFSMYVDGYYNDTHFDAFIECADVQ